MSTLNELTAARDDLNRRIAHAAAQALAADIHCEVADRHGLGPTDYRIHVRFDHADDGGPHPFAYLRLVTLDTVDDATQDRIDTAALDIESEFQSYATFLDWADAEAAAHGDLYEHDVVLPSPAAAPESEAARANVAFPYGRCGSCGNGIDVSGQCATVDCSQFAYDDVCRVCGGPFVNLTLEGPRHADTHGSTGQALDADHTPATDDVEWAARSDKAHKQAITAVTVLHPEWNRRQAAEWLRTSHRVNWSPTKDPAYAVAEAYSTEQQTQATFHAVAALAEAMGLADGTLTKANPVDGAAWVMNGDGVMLQLADGRELWAGTVTTNAATGEESGGWSIARLYANGRVQEAGIETGLPLRCADPLRIAKAFVKTAGSVQT